MCVLGLGGGGFHFEAEYLLSTMGGDIDLVLIYAIDSQVDGNWRSPFPVHRAFAFRSPGLWRDTVLHRIKLILHGIWTAGCVLVATETDCILAVGSAQAFPFSIAGRLLGVPTFFLESVTRVHTPSQTGRLMGRLRLATKYFAQWKPLLVSERATYAGSIIQ